MLQFLAKADLMTKLRMAFLCLAVGLAASLVTFIVARHYFLPQQSAGAAANPMLSVPPPYTAHQNLAALSQPAQTRASVEKICESDIAKICSNDKSNIPTECLQDHFNEVSPSCRKSLQATRDTFQPCESQIVQYCSNAGYGGGRMLKCLRQNEPHLSEACARAIQNL